MTEKKAITGNTKISKLFTNILFSIRIFFKYMAIKIEKKPFEKSNIKVNKAKPLLPVRKTFVAPMLPLPILRISLTP